MSERPFITGEELVAESILTFEQARRADALRTAGAVTGRTGSMLTIRSQSAPGVLPGDLVRVAHWIITGEVYLAEGERQYTHRDKRSGWVTISELRERDPDD